MPTILATKVYRIEHHLQTHLSLPWGIRSTQKRWFKLATKARLDNSNHGIGFPPHIGGRDTEGPFLSMRKVPQFIPSNSRQEPTVGCTQGATVKRYGNSRLIHVREEGVSKRPLSDGLDDSNLQGAYMKYRQCAEGDSHFRKALAKNGQEVEELLINYKESFGSGSVRSGRDGCSAPR